MTPTEQIKDRLSIVDVVGEYVKLEKAGINYKAKCPFHNEKTASFFVSPSRQSFYCFGCGEKGDIFTFVEKFEGLDFKTALATLADKAGVILPKFSREKPEEKDEKQILYRISEAATKHFEQNLDSNKSAVEYLKKRGLAQKQIEKWRLGFAKDEWRDLHDTLLAQGFAKANILKAGFLKEKEGKFYDTFRARVMFPISDATGKIIAFSGRTFPDKEGSPKYLNSPETPIFHKSEVLYGWHLAKTAIRKLDYVVLVEGQMDLLLSHKAGVANTVASSGTALTPDHLRKIKKLTNRIIIAYDSDAAGEKAAERAAALALSLEMEVKIAELPLGEDPASLALKDEENWKSVLREAKHLIDFCLNKISRGKKGVALMKEVERIVLPYFGFIKSEIERSHFVLRIANKIGVDEETVMKEITRFKSSPHSFVATKVRESSTPERMLAGMVFLGHEKDLQERWEKLLGKLEVDTILEQFLPEREALIFEAEEAEASGKELLDRLELKIIKEELRNETQNLDEADTESREKSKKKIEQISKRIHELSKTS